MSEEQILSDLLYWASALPGPQYPYDFAVHILKKASEECVDFGEDSLLARRLSMIDTKGRDPLVVVFWSNELGRWRLWFQEVDDEDLIDGELTRPFALDWKEWEPPEGEHQLSAKIIGITGFKRSGKTETGNILSTLGYRQYALADGVKAVAKLAYGFTEDEVQGNSGYDREQIVPDLGLSVRQVLQKIGTEVAREIYDETWIRMLKKRISEDRRGLFVEPLVVVTDVRFLNEAEAIWEMGGEVWRVDREGVDLDDTHPSELSILDIEPDFVLKNNSTLDALTVRIAKRISCKGSEK